MSIINSMLRDLDQRAGRPAGETVTGDAVRSVGAASQWHVSRSAALVLLSLVVLAAGAYAWMNQRAAATTLPIQPAPARGPATIGGGATRLAANDAAKHPTPSGAKATIASDAASSPTAVSPIRR